MSYGNGSVFKRADGRWVAKIIHNGKPRMRYAKTKHEAETKLRELWEDLAKEEVLRSVATTPEKTTPTVAEFAETWLASATIKPLTEQGYRNSLKAHILPAIGSKRLHEITPQDVAAVVQSVLRKGRSGRTAEYAYMITRRLLQVATDWEVIDRNPAAKVKRPQAEHREHVVWNQEQTRAFIESCKGGNGAWDELFIVALLSGLRLGELLGLQWHDVDFAAKTLSVKRNLVELQDGTFHLQTPKTRAAIRSIAVTGDVIAALQGRYEAAGRPKATAHVFSRIARDTRFNHYSAAGVYPRRNAIKESLTRACRRANVPRLTLHGLRHMHVSLLAAAGVPIRDAQKRVGHATPFVTLSVYTHVIGDSETRAASALDNFLDDGAKDRELSRLRGRVTRLKRQTRQKGDETEGEAGKVGESRVFTVSSRSGAVGCLIAPL